MRLNILLWAVTSALAGFLFGFDTVVISGAEKSIQSLWHLSAAAHGMVIASALYGTVVGALIGGWPADRFGRRPTLLTIGVLYLAGAIWSALATDVNGFIIARVLGGLGIGMSTVAAPLYIAEISPPLQRGRLTGLFQFNIVFGILIAYASNAMLSGVQSDAWRWMLGIAALPSLIYTVLCMALPESPRWLLSRRRDRAGGVRVLKMIQPSASDADIELQADAIERAALVRGDKHPFWSKRLRQPIALAFMIAFFNQMSGINAILYFAPRIFELSGLAAKAALLQSIGIGLTNLLFTFIGLWLIDRLGRRTLLLIGSVGYIVSLSVVAFAFFTSHLAVVPTFLFLFIAAHAVGQGVTIWVYIAEIFPNRYRAEGQALGGSTHWIFAALLTTFFPQLVTLFPPGYAFLFFAVMMVLQLVWVKVSVVETKGVPLETIAERLDMLDRS
jgi:MFS transporter, SP family, arabinose:H+ symporter